MSVEICNAYIGVERQCFLQALFAGMAQLPTSLHSGWASGGIASEVSWQ